MIPTPTHCFVEIVERRDERDLRNSCLAPKFSERFVESPVAVGFRMRDKVAGSRQPVVHFVESNEAFKLVGSVQ